MINCTIFCARSLSLSMKKSFVMQLMKSAVLQSFSAVNIHLHWLTASVIDLLRKHQTHRNFRQLELTL